MFKGFDLVKAGKIASVMIKGGRVGVCKIASAAYAELERLAQEDEKQKKGFSTVNDTVESTKNTKEGDKNGSV